LAATAHARSTGDYHSSMAATSLRQSTGRSSPASRPHPGGRIRTLGPSWEASSVRSSAHRRYSQNPDLVRAEFPTPTSPPTPHTLQCPVGLRLPRIQTRWGTFAASSPLAKRRRPRHPQRCHPEAHALCGPKDLCNFLRCDINRRPPNSNSVPFSAGCPISRVLCEKWDAANMTSRIKKTQHTKAAQRSIPAKIRGRAWLQPCR
jgi:hypothetical protein